MVDSAREGDEVIETSVGDSVWWKRDWTERI